MLVRRRRFGDLDERSVRRLALVCWAILLVVVAGRLLLAQKVNHSVYFVFQNAGQRWVAGEGLYGTTSDLFRYSPTVAAFFAPWSYLPQRAAEVLWRCASAAAWIASLLYFFRACVPTFDTRLRWAAVLGSLPLALLSVNNGQANIALGALLFAALGDAQRERWNRCAVLLAAAVLFKVWPIAAAGLLVVCFPWKLGPRVVLALAAGMALPFLVQRWEYVAGEYRSWASYLVSDLRTDLNVLYGYRDFWMLNRLVGQPLTLFQYQILQVGSGVALAAAVAWLTWRRRPSDERIRFVAFAGSFWMLGFGPSTESSTYSLMGPLLAWAWFDPTRRSESRVERLLLLLSFGLFGAALASVPTPYCRFIETLGPQPLGTAVLFVRMLVGGRPVRVPTEPAAAVPLRRAA